MKHILGIFLFLLTFTSFAGESTKDLSDYYEANIILSTIDNLEKDGYITSKNAEEAKQKFVFDNNDLKERMEDYVSSNSSDKKVDSSISFTEYITLVNTIKFLASIALIIAFHGLIFKVFKNIIEIIIAVPQIIYQLLFFSLSLTMTFSPEIIWASEAFYLALLGSFLNIFILIWFVITYPDACNKLLSLISLGVKKDLLAAFYLTLYFGMLAILYSSSAFGLFSVMALVSLTGFAFYHSNLTLALGVEKEGQLPVVIGTNLLILIAYSTMKILNIEVMHLEYFQVGIEYVCSIALGICLLIASAPFRDSKVEAAYSILMILVSGTALIGSTFYGLSVIGAILNTCFVLFVLEYLAYLTYKVHYIFMTFVIGISLYGLALLVEANPQYFVNSLF